MAKIVKTYEAFIARKDFKYEEEVIDPILNCIKEHQHYLTQPENLPQLAKLGYMYNTLWYAGRVCWGYDGILSKKYGTPKVVDEDGEEYQYSSCEDNPKYKIEMCDPETPDIENLIYDAWGMHVSDMRDNTNYEKFRKIVLEGKELSEFEKRMRKPNKTFDEWVNILTDKEYKYRYTSRKDVANHLLCVIGNGYGFSKDGFVIKEASGADQDEDLYGEWENAKFSGEIKNIVDKIVNMPEVKETLEAYDERNKEYVKKELEQKRKDYKLFYDILKRANLYKDEEGDLSHDEIFDRLDQMEELKGIISTRKSKSKEYHPYYPISSSSIIHLICDPESQKREGIRNIDPSYINAAKEICYDILKHAEIEDKAIHKTNNTEKAKLYLAYLGEPGFSVPKTHDKYKLLEDIKDYFAHLTDDLPELKKGDFNQGMYGKDNHYIYLKDTAVDSYGDNNYYLYFNFSPASSTTFPKGASSDIDFIKSSKYYDDIKSAFDRLNSREEVKFIEFHFENDKYAKIQIVIHTNPKTYKYAMEKIKSDNDFRGMGFEVGMNKISLILDKLNIKLSIRKPQSLGSSHPNNKNGKEYFSNALEMDVTDATSGANLFKMHIDERNFNTCYCNHMPSNAERKKLVNWVLSEHAKMKASDPSYGKYDSKSRSGGEGKKCLYAHDFMLWLRDNQENFK